MTMAVASLASLILSFLQFLFAIIDVGLAGYVNNVGWRGYDWGSKSLRFQIATGVLTGILAVVCLLLSFSGTRISAVVRLSAAVFSAILWLISIAWMGSENDGYFDPNDGCTLDENGAWVNPMVCHIYRVGLAAWVFGFLLLLLWICSGAAAFLAIFSGNRGQQQMSSANPANTAGPFPQNLQKPYATQQQPQMPPPGQQNNFQPMHVQQQQPNVPYTPQSYGAPQPYAGLKPSPV